MKSEYRAIRKSWRQEIIKLAVVNTVYALVTFALFGIIILNAIALH